MVTVMSTKPAAWAGEVTVSEVPETTLTLVPAVPPKLTLEPLTKLVPVTVTEVPPGVGPEVGFTAVTVGVTAL